MRLERRAPFAVALALLAAAAGCSGRKGAAGLVRSSPLGTYPRESAALLVVEVKKIRTLRPDAPWIRDLAALPGRQEGLPAAVLRRLGPDVLEKLDRLSLAIVPRPDRTVGYGVLAEGPFDAERMRQDLGGGSLMTLVEAGDVDLSVVVLKDGSVALGPKGVLETMVANEAARGKGLDANPGILTPLEQVRQESQIWGAVDCHSLQAAFKDSRGPGEVAGLSLDSAPVQSLASIAFRGTMGDTIDIDLLGRADNESGARTLADAARGLVALGRVGAGRDQAKEWLDLLDGIRISQSGAGIVLHASIPSKTMESFVAQMTRPSAAEAQAQASPATPETAPRSPAARTAADVPGAPSPQGSPAPRKPASATGKAAPGGAPSPPGKPSTPAPKPQGTRTPSDGAP